MDFIFSLDINLDHLFILGFLVSLAYLGATITTNVNKHSS